MENGKDNIDRRIEGGQVVRRDIRFGDHVPQCAEGSGDRPAAGKADVPFDRWAATQVGD